MPQVPPPKRHPYDQWSPDARALDLVGDKWTLLIVRDLIAGPRRFVELQRVLPGISTEQLRSRLNRMVADDMLTRKRYREVPPRVDYELTPRARDLLPVLSELAQWGYRWAWSAPHAGERIDVAAFFRLAPGLVDARPEDGEIELNVTDVEETYTLSLNCSGPTVTEVSSDSPVATVSGDTAAWVKAFSADADLSALQISGDHGLASEVVAQLNRTGNELERADEAAPQTA
jgi:DNA-binding HxlR family transcriptional regulator